MNFNSLSFAIFCPIVFVLYWAVKDRYKWIILLASSYYFYMCWNVKYIVLIFGTTLISYICALLLEKADSRKLKKLILASALVICLGVLFVYKYYNFTMETIVKVTDRFSIHLNPVTSKLLLPVGISFYTFQTLSYVIDVYRGDLKAEHHFGKYAAFISFFPQLVAGPIERADNLLPQIKEPEKFDYDNAAYGMRLAIVGFFKKLVIADNLGMFVDYVYQAEYFAGVHVILAIFAFSIQIYCDFSGYSDIAIGTAKLFNINLIKNFDSPYFSASVKEFWRRWHISLSNWFRDYLYIPLGGNRRGFMVSKLNVIFVFLVSGLWHRAGWNYVVWGGMHGVAQLFNNRKVNKNVKHNAVWWLKVLLTFLFVTLTWMVFRLGITETVNTLSGLSWRWCSFSESMDRIVDNTLLTHAKLALVAVCAVLLMVYDYFSLKRDLLKEFGRLNVVVRCAVYVFMIMFILFEMPLVVTSRFIYFQF